MKLDRNINAGGLGKYAILLLRNLETFRAPGPFGELAPSIRDAIETLEKAGLIDWGITGTDKEFFLIRLKDKYAAEALSAYAFEARKDDVEYADEISDMAERAGPNSPFCKRPD